MWSIGVTLFKLFYNNINIFNTNFSLRKHLISIINFLRSDLDTSKEFKNKCKTMDFNEENYKVNLSKIRNKIILDNSMNTTFNQIIKTSIFL